MWKILTRFWLAKKNLCLPVRTKNANRQYARLRRIPIGQPVCYSQCNTVNVLGSVQLAVFIGRNSARPSFSQNKLPAFWMIRSSRERRKCDWTIYNILILYAFSESDVSLRRIFYVFRAPLRLVLPNRATFDWRLRRFSTIVYGLLQPCDLLLCVKNAQKGNTITKICPRGYHERT